MQIDIQQKGTTREPKLFKQCLVFYGAINMGREAIYIGPGLAANWRVGRPTTPARLAMLCDSPRKKLAPRPHHRRRRLYGCHQSKPNTPATAEVNGLTGTRTRSDNRTASEVNQPPGCHHGMRVNTGKRSRTTNREWHKVHLRHPLRKP